MAATLEQGVLLLLIAGAATLEVFFILRAFYEIRTARLYQELVEDIRRASPPKG